MGELPKEDPEAATSDTGFSSWVTLGGSFKGGPTVVRSNDGRLEVFGRGADNSIWHKYQAEPNPPAWTQWMTLGTRSAARSPATSSGPSGSLSAVCWLRP